MDISKLMSKIGADSKERSPMDTKLKKLLLYYAISALFATILISGSVLTEAYIVSLSDTLDKFQTLKINSIKMKESSRKAGETFAAVRTAFSSYDKTEAMEGILLTTVDSIKERMKGADVTVTNFEKKGSEIELPLALTGTIQDYADFINHIGYLQSLPSPIFYMSGVTITDQSDEKNAVINFEIRGTLKMQTVLLGGSS
jgi:Tfp pilus assembly protein PilO